VRERFPNLRSLTTCCVCLEPRPLPSTGITRFHRYYGPLRHPSAPGLSLTGVRLIIPDHAKGLPACAFLVYVLPPLPRCSRWAYSSLLLTHLCQPSPEGSPGRPAHCPFRGLLGVHSRCGPHTRAVTKYVTRYPKASAISLPPRLLRLLPAGAVAGWDSHPLEKRRLFTAHTQSGPWLKGHE
jgi:hypothetical protein